jgi:hypothetical protein
VQFRRATRRMLSPSVVNSAKPDGLHAVAQTDDLTPT